MIVRIPPRVSFRKLCCSLISFSSVTRMSLHMSRPAPAQHVSGNPTAKSNESSNQDKAFVPLSVTRFELLKWLSGDQKPGKDFVLVDVRREDHQGGTIQGSINLPAQSMSSTILPLYNLLSSAHINTAVFYCGSSRHRGTAAAKLLQDLIIAKGDVVLKSYILSEGINGWARGGQEYVDFMDDYQAEFWR